MGRSRVDRGFLKKFCEAAESLWPDFSGVDRRAFDSLVYAMGVALARKPSDDETRSRSGVAALKELLRTRTHAVPSLSVSGSGLVDGSLLDISHSRDVQRAVQAIFGKSNKSGFFGADFHEENWLNPETGEYEPRMKVGDEQYDFTYGKRGQLTARTQMKRATASRYSKAEKTRMRHEIDKIEQQMAQLRLDWKSAKKSGDVGKAEKIAVTGKSLGRKIERLKDTLRDLET